MFGCEVRRACDTKEGWRRFKTNLDIITEEMMFVKVVIIPRVNVLPSRKLNMLIELDADITPK